MGLIIGSLALLGLFVQFIGAYKVYKLRELENDKLPPSNASENIAAKRMSVIGVIEELTPEDIENESNEIRKDYNVTLSKLSEENRQRFLTLTKYFLYVIFGFLLQSLAVVLDIFCKP